MVTVKHLRIHRMERLMVKLGYPISIDRQRRLLDTLKPPLDEPSRQTDE